MSATIALNLSIQQESLNRYKLYFTLQQSKFKVKHIGKGYGPDSLKESTTSLDRQCT